MAQKYKAVYFADMPGESSQQKSLTIAFGKRSEEVFSAVKDITSLEIRTLLGTESYLELVVAATQEDLPINTYCIRKLRNALQTIRETSSQLTLPGVRTYSDSNNLFDPLTVTFKGGAKEPFIRWYPYLEGYSPEFVETIIGKYASNAKRILDPFSGTGTTAFTGARLGIETFFCEINPVLQFISLTKATVRRLNGKIRDRIAVEILEIAEQFSDLTRYSPDIRLQETYIATFEESEYFDANTYLDVLRLRTWIDAIALNRPLLADLFTIAVISSLVEASKLIRAGDLRYRTEKEKIGQTPLIELVRRNIFNIAEDIQGDINGFETTPFLICENALSIARIPNLHLDAVITSPPYVNGTNYFRNTKMELWFLRCLREKKDLSRFRSVSITAGINDVTTSKVPVFLEPEVERVVNDLAAVAYDSRIPRMIGAYFYELTQVFRGISFHLRPEAVVAIDLGDSAYAGIHVPSDRLLASCIEPLGYEQKGEVILRNRRSRGGANLKQSLLIFSYCPTPKRFVVKELIQPWHPQWTLFKQHLPHQQQPFAKRNWGHQRHSLCSYQGKLKPAIAHHLVNIFVPHKGSVLDPFAGVGTIPFEAALQGKISFGFDINPVAFAVASAKVGQPTLAGCIGVLNELQAFLSHNSTTDAEIDETRQLGFNGKIFEYYSQLTLGEIILARRFFRENHPRTDDDWFVLASLLHILHGNRPYALSRRSHPITPYRPTGPFDYRPLIQKLKDKVERGFTDVLSDRFQPGRMYFQDATGWWPREVDKLDAIITSPPFFDSTRFYLANWLRLWFAGWTRLDFEMRPLGFVDERQKTGFEVYESIIRQARERLKSDGVLVLHLGKSKKCDMAAELEKLGRKWFRFSESFDETVIHCESHGIRDKGTVTSHQYLILY